MKTVCASEMAAILKIIENCFRPKMPQNYLYGVPLNSKTILNLIYIKSPSINGDITKNVKS